MTASATVTNSVDELTAAATFAATVANRFLLPTAAAANVSLEALQSNRNSNDYNVTASLHNNNNINSSNNNHTYNNIMNPTLYVHVASTSLATLLQSPTQDNASFVYDEYVEQDALNRSLLLLTTVATATMTAAATATSSNETGSHGDDGSDGEWSHFYDLILSWQGICLIAVFCTFIVITIIGNTLIILAVITTRRLKTVTNCFVMSLAVADLLVGIFVMPPAVAVHLIGSWQLGWILCDIWISLDVLLCTASILSLCAISVDRYLAVTQPLTYSRKRRSKRLALIMILIVWALALAITCPPMFGWYEPGRRDLSECRYNQNEGYVIFSAMGSFFIPMAVMIYVYARISCVIASRHDNMTDISIHNKKFKRYTSADVENDNEHEHEASEQELSSSQKREAAARTLSTQEVMLSGGNNAGASSSQCPLVAIATANAKNGCYELTCPATLKRTQTTLSTQQQQQQQQQQQRQQHILRQQQLRASAAGGGGSILIASPHLDGGTTPVSYTTRNTRVHHHHHHHHQQHPKSLTNRISSLKKENKTTQTLSIVVGGFIACWLPFFIYYLITPFLDEHQVSRNLAKGLTWLGWFNSAINPFIYAFYSVDFRAAFWRLTCKRFFSGSSKQQFPSNTMSIRR